MCEYSWASCFLFTIRHQIKKDPSAAQRQNRRRWYQQMDYWLLISTEVNYFPLAERSLEVRQELVPDLLGDQGSLPSRKHREGEDQKKRPKERNQNLCMQLQSEMPSHSCSSCRQAEKLLGPIFTEMYSLKFIANVIYTPLHGKQSA